MEVMINEFKILVEKPEGRNHPRDLYVGGIILNSTIKNAA
jgi:hypothetical protein